MGTRSRDQVWSITLRTGVETEDTVQLIASDSSGFSSLRSQT